MERGELAWLTDFHGVPHLVLAASTYHIASPIDIDLHYFIGPKGPLWYTIVWMKSAEINSLC